MAASGFADFVDRDDIWVVEQRNGFGLVAEAADFLKVGELTGADHLECDVPVERSLPRAPNQTHPAEPERFEQFVIAGEFARLPAPERRHALGKLVWAGRRRRLEQTRHQTFRAQPAERCGGERLTA